MHTKRMHLDCLVSLVLLFICYPGNFYVCCNEQKRNEVTMKNTDLNKCRMSIQTMWRNGRDKKKSADLLECLEMETCHVNVTKSKNNTCLCTSKMCAKIRCNDFQKNFNPVTITCKIEKVATDHDDCSPVIDELTDKYTLEKDTSTCEESGKKEYKVGDIRLHIKVISVLETEATLDLKDQDNVMIFQKIQDAVIDLQNCSNSHCSVIVISRDSTVYLCVTGMYKNICIIAKCKQAYFKRNEKICNNMQDMSYTLTNIWKHWKDKIILFLFGAFLFGGMMGFWMGMIFARKRKMRVLIERKKQYPRHTCNSEMYAEIGESSNIIERDQRESICKEAEHGIETNMGATVGLVSRSLSRYSLDGAYSNIYNVLQTNYGRRRNSYPIDDIDAQKMPMKYYCLEKVDTLTEI